MSDGVGMAEVMRGTVGPPGGSVEAERDAMLGRVVALAADLFDAPLAFLALWEGGEARITAPVGLDAAAAGRGLPAAFPLDAPGSLALADLALDGRAAHHPLAAAPFAARFYAGAPFVARGGAVSGVLCALDRVARPAPSRREMGRLEALAALALDAVEGRLALERAEAAAEARADLLADVSHELRTPLNGIVGFTEILKREGPLAEDARRSVERIEEAGRGLLSIVDDALDLSRLGRRRRAARRPAVLRRAPARGCRRDGPAGRGPQGARARRRPAGRPARTGARRPRPASPGPAQPARQCGEVHRRRAPCGRASP